MLLTFVAEFGSTVQKIKKRDFFSKFENYEAKNTQNLSFSSYSGQG